MAASPEDEWWSSLSVKSAKHLLKAKQVDATNCVEKRHLLALVRESVASKAEADALLAKPAPSLSSSASGGGQAASSSADREKALAALARLKRLPPQQARYQANIMKRDPAYVRRQNKDLKAATNDEIRAAGEEMEATAAEIEKSPGLAERMADEQQIDMWLELLKRPADLKAHLKKMPGMQAVSDTLLDGQIDALQQMDQKVLRTMMSLVAAVKRAVLPWLTFGYKVVDKISFGNGKWVVLVLVLVSAYYSFRFAIYVFMAVVRWLLRLVGWTSTSADSGVDGGAAAPEYSAPAPTQTIEPETTEFEPVPAGIPNDEEDEWAGEF